MEIGIKTLGLLPKDLYELTPHELKLLAQNHADKKQDEYNLALFTAWHAEAFHRSKKLPKLNKILKLPKKKKESKKDLTSIFNDKELKKLAEKEVE